MKRTIAALVLAVAGCATVDETEHCVHTRYGKVVEQHMGTGINWTFPGEVECFSLTQQNFPADGEVEQIQAQTADPVTVTGDVAIVFSFDPGTVFDVFMEKRSEPSARAEILNGIREGYRTAMAGWTVAEIFSERRAALADSVRAHIQRKVGDRALIHQVFVRDIAIPQQIEQARIEAARQAQILARARQQFVIDSVNAAALVMTATAQAEAKELSAEAYLRNPTLVQLEIAQAIRDGLSHACDGSVQQCVIGGSVMDAFMARGGRP